MIIRPITQEEIPAFLKLAQYSFGDYEDKEPEQDRIDRFEVDGTLAAFDGDTLASQMYIHEFEQSVRGRVTKMGGIGAVGTLPEYRGGGIVRKLVTESFTWMRDREIPVSMLRPFKEAYYEKYGYVRTSHSIRVDVPNSSFFSYLGSTAPDLTVTRLPSSQAREPYFSALRTSFTNAHGRVLHEELSDANFRERFKNRIFVFVRRGERVVAMLAYGKKGFLDEGKLTVSDFFWTDREALRAVYDFFALHRDQIETVSLSLPFDANLTAMIPRLVGATEMKFVAAPWMVRVVDVRSMLDGFPIEGSWTDGEKCTLGVDDPICDWNQTPVTLTARDGRILVSDGPQSPDVVLSVSALSAALYGSFPMAQIVAEFPPAKANQDSMEMLDRWFPARTLFNDFWF